jgi:hypothetical protein
VLQNVRVSDVVVLVLSPASVASQACNSEWEYAARLGKPLLPIQVAPLSVETLPSGVGKLHIVDYVSPNEESAFRLARAVHSLPTPRPLPVPLPAAPPVPFSYLTGLAEQVRRPPPALDGQLSLVSRLETALKSADPSERRAAAELVTALQSRTDIYAETLRRCERLQPSVAAAAAAGSPSDTGAPKRSESTTGTSGCVKVLAWIGAIVLILFGVALCSTDQAPCFDYLGNEVAC